jgi:hypothetical protein
MGAVLCLVISSNVSYVLVATTHGAWAERDSLAEFAIGSLAARALLAEFAIGETEWTAESVVAECTSADAAVTSRQVSWYAVATSLLS